MWPILAWARTPVAPVGGALAHCSIHDLAQPLVAQLLAQAGLPAQAVDALLLGNALGANGNPARMVALASGLPERVAAVSIDSQCCAGMDAVTHACAWLALGQADIAIAGGAEAWSRAPIRMHRPLDATQAPVPFERPAFAPWPQRDPDLFDAAATGAAASGCTRLAQDAWAVLSHQRARAYSATSAVDAPPRPEIVPLAGLAHDAYPRALTATRAARMPQLRAAHDAQGRDCGLSQIAVSPKADGAALLLLASPQACARWGVAPRAYWRAGVTLGAAPEQPMQAAQQAALTLLQRQRTTPEQLAILELHDAFAAQALGFAAALGVAPQRLNQQGGGLARGHPIGASGAIALVQALAQLVPCVPWAPATPGQLALVAIAGAGGLGSATLLEAAGADSVRF